MRFEDPPPGDEYLTYSVVIPDGASARFVEVLIDDGLVTACWDAGVQPAGVPHLIHRKGTRRTYQVRVTR